MPSPQTLPSARIQFLSGIGFIATSAIFFLSNVISRVELDSLYRTAMFLSSVHYGAALVQQLPELSLNPVVLEKAISSAYLSSLLLSAFFWITKDTFTVQLVPMMVYCAFACAEIASKDSEIQSNIYWRRYGKRYLDLILPRHQLLVNLSAHLEILTLVLIVVSLLRFKGSLIQLAVFTQYLVVQYTLSSSMKVAILSWDGIVRRLVSDPRCPPAVKAADAYVRDFLGRLATTTAEHVHPPRAK